MLFERAALSKNPESVIASELAQLRDGHMTPDLVFRDPYLLDLLDLKGACTNSASSLSGLRAGAAAGSSSASRSSLVRCSQSSKSARAVAGRTSRPSWCRTLSPFEGCLQHTSTVGENGLNARV